MDYDTGRGNSRNKGKGKRKENKKHPYHAGGKFRSGEVPLTKKKK